MAAIIIPVNPVFNTTAVEECKQSDFVVDTHFNGYMLTLLQNDQYLKNTEEALELSVTSQISSLSANIMAVVERELQTMQQTIEGSMVQECSNADIDAIII